MSRIRVMELAKELGMDNKVTIAKLAEVGVHVKNHFNALSDIDADKLRAYLRTGKNPDKSTAAASSKVLIRRRGASDEPEIADEPPKEQPKVLIRRRAAETSPETGPAVAESVDSQQRTPSLTTRIDGSGPAGTAAQPAATALGKSSAEPEANAQKLSLERNIESKSSSHRLAAGTTADSAQGAEAFEKLSNDQVASNVESSLNVQQRVQSLGTESQANTVSTETNTSKESAVPAVERSQVAAQHLAQGQSLQQGREGSKLGSQESSTPATRGTESAVGAATGPTTTPTTAGSSQGIPQSRIVPRANQNLMPQGGDSANVGSSGATVVRRPERESGAVIVRRSPPTSPGMGGTSPSSASSQGGFRSGSSAGPSSNRGSSSGPGGGSYEGRGRSSYDSESRYDRQDSRGGSQEARGPYVSRPEGRNSDGRSGPGGYRSDGRGYSSSSSSQGPGSSGSYPGRSPSGSPGAGFRSDSRGPGSQGSGGFRSDRPGGPGGPGGRPGMGGSGAGAGGPGSRYGRPGSDDFRGRPSEGGFRGGGPSPLSLPADALGGTRTEIAGRVDRSHNREKDKEKRKLYTEEEVHKRTKLKQSNSDEEFLDVEVDDDASDSAGVRNFIPQRRRGGGKRKELVKTKETANPMKASKRVVRIDDSITVSSLAQEMSVKSSAVIKSLMSLGMLATVNQRLDTDTAVLVAQEFGFDVQNVARSIGDILSTESHSATQEEQFELITRAPVVTIMGHVDHGKTSLLDAIRHSNKTASEAGGITQHIGAYRVNRDGRPVTFIDTPGHAAFTEMRARGAKVTDVVILVVAADDGVMPQTIEAINHAKSAGVPIVVAVNKIDKPTANYDRILSEMASHGVTAEEWGGDSMFVKVSALTKLGIGELLDAVLLQAEVLDLRARTEGLAEGVVIESKLDKARGPVATFLVSKGILRKGDSIVAGKCSGRVRALFDDEGNKIEEVYPGVPVEILGLDAVPNSGDTFNVVANDSVAKQAVQYRVDKDRKERAAAIAKTNIQELLAQLGSGHGEKKELPIIIKADTHGSVEAIRGSLEKLATEQVSCKVVHAAVGGITETDVSLASAANAIVIGFNVRPDRKSTELSEEHGVEIKTFSIIYELIESVERAMAGKLEPIRHERIQGHAEVRNVFSVPKVGNIAGSYITDGKVNRSSLIRVVRDGIVLFTGKVSSLKRFKDDAKEVGQGYECGIGVENYNDLKVGDVLESFYIEEVAATLRPAGAQHGASASHSSSSETQSGGN